MGRQLSLLSPLDCLSAKTDGTVNGGAYAPFILTVDWLGWLCYFHSLSRIVDGIAGGCLSICCVTLWHMSIRTGVVVAVTFQQVDDTPDAETSAQSDNEGLKNGDSPVSYTHLDVYKRQLYMR